MSGVVSGRTLMRASLLRRLGPAGKDLREGPPALPSGRYHTPYTGDSNPFKLVFGGHRVIVPTP